MTAVPEPALIDTNVLVYALFPAMPEHTASRALLDTAKTAGANLCIAPQNLIEFFVVTDARRVTQPKTPAEALLARDGFLALLGLSLLLVPGDLTQAAALADVRLTGELKSMSTAFARMRDRSTPAPWPTKLGRRR